MPLDAVVQPALHEHCPLAPQTPFRQLQADERLAVVDERQRPEPVIPSSQVVQPAMHAWHEGPKNPFAQTSQDVPLNPEGHVHWPDAEHTPALEHGGEQALDSIAERDNEDTPGSWDMSGTESQIMMRSLPVVTAIQRLEDMAIEPAEKGVDELLDAGEVGRAENCACPEYNAWG